MVHVAASVGRPTRVVGLVMGLVCTVNAAVISARSTMTDVNVGKSAFSERIGMRTRGSSAVAVLAQHDPTGWAKDSACHSSSR